MFKSMVLTEILILFFFLVKSNPWLTFSFHHCHPPPDEWQDSQAWVVDSETKAVSCRSSIRFLAGDTLCWLLWEAGSHPGCALEAGVGWEDTVFAVGAGHLD